MIISIRLSVRTWKQVPSQKGRIVFQLNFQVFLLVVSFREVTPPKTNISMDISNHECFDGKSPIKNGDFPAIAMLVFKEGNGSQVQ